MKKLIYTVGLPASGKSTWAKEYVRNNPGTIRANRDDLRILLHDGKWSKANEKIVVQVQNTIIANGLANDQTVIVDDTNFAPSTVANLKALAKTYGADIEIKDFTDVDVQTCIDRDNNRHPHVGEGVIRRMFDQYLCKARKSNGKKPCVIVDIDGTLAHIGDRSPFDWSKVHLDTVNEMIREVINGLYEKYFICVTSGRDSECREATERWLNDNDVQFNDLFMRTKGDNRKDSIVKRELLHNEILPHYNPVLAIDDRQQVVDLWRSEGIECWQVATGRF